MILSDQRPSKPAVTGLFEVRKTRKRTQNLNAPGAFNWQTTERGETTKGRPFRRLHSFLLQKLVISLPGPPDDFGAGTGKIADLFGFIRHATDSRFCRPIDSNERAPGIIIKDRDRIFVRIHRSVDLVGHLKADDRCWMRQIFTRCKNGGKQANTSSEFPWARIHPIIHPGRTKGCSVSEGASKYERRSRLENRPNHRRRYASPLMRRYTSSPLFPGLCC